jgi:UDP-N-acetylmuramoyl-tripeptide--D-alanyl-D-alanine ligase
MKNMTLETVARCTGGQLFLPEGKAADPQQKARMMAAEIQGVVIDNRQVEPGYLFVPMKGSRVDGHSFIENALERGALGVLSAHPLERAVGPYILVEDTAVALKALAAYYRSTLDTYIIGIVGSVGKTSTKEMVSSVLEQHFRVLKTQGNLNNEIGLPLTLCRIRQEHQVAVVEMGISDFGEMDRLGAMAKPDMVIMTNIGLCHLENLGTRDGILKAKSEVFAHMPQDGILILNGDDDKLQKADTQGKKVITYGLAQEAFHAAEVESRLTEVEALLCTPDWQQKIRIPIPGEHNVYNALAAAAAATTLGLTQQEITAGIEHSETILGRNHFISCHGITVIDDCYNANPVSMKASLEVLSHAAGRKIAVLGDMGELGEQEKQLHYQVGEIAADDGIDLLFTAGPLAKEMARAFADRGRAGDVFSFADRDEMTEALLKEQKKGDTILVKASHFMDFTRVVEALTAGE